MWGSRSSTARPSARARLPESTHLLSRRARKIIAGENHRPAINIRSAEYEVGQGEGLQRAFVVVFTHARKRADFVERLAVGNMINALADSEFVEFVLSRDFVGAAHFECGSPRGYAFRRSLCPSS